ncbi:two-component sensor histidine kinase [Azorhizobium oxalatiphilum]|uniref:histidine kinase n=1 Tax=Azorhizobium oxalatiphilum TaxID=980631 RepID=A0A917FEB2_9HYPH|nr:cache domain-containing protein [Azorhizobium oxalatiphilum]GGF71130.1 two-component sensor histidine kinase [Azorhizobium oxalatiphilum]
MSDAAAPAPHRRWRHSVRYRLLAIALLPTAIILPALLILAVIWWSAMFDRLLTAKVSGDLTIARQYLNRLMEHSGEALHAVGDSAAFADLLRADRPAEIGTFLARRRESLALDYLYVIDADGHVLAAAPPRQGAMDWRKWPVIAKAMDGTSDTGIDVLDAAELAHLSGALASQAVVPLIETPGVAPAARSAEDRGMVIQSAVPVRMPDGSRGALVGGTLLNHNLAFIDTINDLVYQASSLPAGSSGTATLFLDDVRISTNVRLFAGDRALGTRVSEAVRHSVLEEGRVWLDRAFVVDDWYISAYEPILDSHGRRIGMLYVGFLDRPFQNAKLGMLAAIVIPFALVLLAALPFLLRWAGGIFRPLEQMDGTISRVEAGELGARTGPVGSADEIGRLAHHLDHLLDRIEARDRELRDWANELDIRVAERTSELAAANQRLEETQAQLVMSEKLAAIGEITAGVAHEINNPIAVIQGNLDVARDVLGAQAEPVKTEFRLIDEQVHRITLLVDKLLQFARPYDEMTEDGPLAPADVISDCLLFVRHLLDRADIIVVRSDTANAQVQFNRAELQQVIVNLLVNALHAMPDGGTLTITSRDAAHQERSGVRIAVTDTGIGIPPAHRERIFDAFFTTKASKGSGLGLSISYALVMRHDGQMDVESEEGMGATFSIWLPASTQA